MTILFFGDDVWASRTLDRLVHDGHTLCGVVVRQAPRNASLADTATRLALPLLQPVNVNAPEFVATVRTMAPDLVVSVSYDQIFKSELIAVPRLGALNVHNGMLPNYRGGGGLYGAVINGETSFGQTAHLMTPAIDEGPIVVQRQLPIHPNDTMAELLQRATDSMPDTVAAAVTALLDGSWTPRPQPREGSYFPRKPDGDELIDWSESSRLLLDKIRARVPGPGNVTYLDGRRVVVWKAASTGYPAYRGPVGQVLRRQPDGVVVKTGDSAILLRDVQIDDGPRTVPAFPVGSTFLANWRHAYLELETHLGRLAERVSELERRIASLRPENTSRADYT